MKRLEKLERDLIAKKSQMQFDDFVRSSSIDKQQLKQSIYGPNWHWRDRLMNIIRQNKDVYHHFHLRQSSRQQMREKGAQIMFFTKKAVNIDVDHSLANPNIVSLVSNAMVMYNAGYSIKNGVHIFLYLKSIINLGTQHHKQYINRAANYQDIGCFGLTEILHGSNVRGILTEAHYDHKTRQFIINSPSKEAMKFWIGAAAELANMSVIWAQLYIGNVCHGVHAFIVPIRDPQTHKLLPGVLVGDCGPKNGCDIIDNGFILLDKVRVPVKNLLNRISGVDQNGKFYSTVKSQEQRFGQHLSALSGGRFMIAINSSSMALSALTIAIRFTCVRRQFNTPPNNVENLLIQYPLTKRRMMPLLAQTIVYQMGNFAIGRQWDKNHENILDPTNVIILELHGISSTIKPKSSWFATQCTKECRQMLGGHGYSSLSKLGTLYNDNDINNTWQGDNNVLLQQATKYVLENYGKLLKGKQIKSEILQFLANPPNEADIEYNISNFNNLQFGVKFLQFKIMSKLQDMQNKMMTLKAEEIPNFDIWNACQPFYGQPIALTLGDLFYLTNAISTIQSIKNANNKQVIQVITKLWMLRVYRYDDYIDAIHHEQIQNCMKELCQKVTKESLGLLESLSSDDELIGSPFACPHGRGFEKYMEMIQKSNPVNERPKWWKILKQK